MTIAMPITVAGVLAMVIIAAPAGAVHAQVKPGQDSAAQRTWGVNPGPAGARVARRTEALADTAFIREATSGNLLEVRLGQLAARRTADSAVRSFAGRMVADHGSMQEQWIALGKSDGVPIDIGLTPAQEREVSRLESLSGAAFDREYMTTMIRDHQKDLSTFQRMEPSIRSSDVRRLAASGLTTIEEHLNMARDVARRTGASPWYAVTPSREKRDTAAKNQGAAQVTRERTGLVAADRSLIREMVADHVMEVRLGERAGREARSSETRSFAQRMVSDFGEWRDRWMSLAERNDLKVSTSLGHLHRQKLDRLEKAGKKDVDRTYAAIVAENLGSIVPYFEKEGRSAHSAAVRRLVDQELPLIRERLAQARRLAGGSSDRAEASRRSR